MIVAVVGKGIDLEVGHPCPNPGQNRVGRPCKLTVTDLASELSPHGFNFLNPSLVLPPHHTSCYTSEVHLK